MKLYVIMMISYVIGIGIGGKLRSLCNFGGEMDSLARDIRKTGHDLSGRLHDEGGK